MCKLQIQSPPHRGRESGLVMGPTERRNVAKALAVLRRKIPYHVLQVLEQTEGKSKEEEEKKKAEAEQQADKQQEEEPLDKDIIDTFTSQMLDGIDALYNTYTRGYINTLTPSPVRCWMVHMLYIILTLGCLYYLNTNIDTC